ncbi:hypothetical protein [Neisseria sp.]|uniref:pirin family protein n=1 Tax=Neisseria sp. TaxID=192066 RepID=UPI0035A07B94
MHIADKLADNAFNTILSPEAEGQGVWIHQDAWFSLVPFSDGHTLEYAVKRPENGVYVFIIKGSVAVNGRALCERDGYGIWDAEKFELAGEAGAQVLLMDVPMDIAAHTGG